MAKRAIGQLYKNETFDVQDLVIQTPAKTKVVFVSSTDDHVTYQGTGFKYEDGVLDSGTIKSILVSNEDGDPILKISNLSIKASTVAGDTASAFFASLAVQAVDNGIRYTGTNGSDELATSNGNDILIGKGGDDFLIAGAGRDTLTGGAGFDTFLFREGHGKDTITDFDADGGVGAQDLIDALYADVVGIYKAGKHDTLIDFGGGDTITLLDVRPGEIDVTDFVAQPM